MQSDAPVRVQMLHRDIKPENVLVDGTSVRLCDFGFARCVPAACKLALLTPYVATRWYRAPEMLLGLPMDGGIDVWALGAHCPSLLVLFSTYVKQESANLQV